MKRRRCAIYTRKSTEEGLDQAFNSLDAQREACAAYILSQAHEGWEAVDGSYNDGGWTGGNMDRPALRQLLADVEAGRIDVIVVYKVDRLTRSLADFARIVDTLDKAGASFVSVTQSFNTTNSMGRLTLNVLLSFAQFEREVTSERIRDKIAASKRKGMWMGGPVPLGYRLEDRRLVIDDCEAAIVRALFQRYADLRSVTQLVDRLAREGIRTKVRQHATGRTVGGVPFSRGSLSQLLQNPIYLGKVRHRGELYDGEHDGLVDEDLWNDVQRILATNRRERRNGNLVRYPSLLTGLLHDPEGRPMTPVFTNRESRRHHYYMTRLRAGEDAKVAWRVPAGEVDSAVIKTVEAALRAGNGLIDEAACIQRRMVLADCLADMSVPEQRGVLHELNIQAHLELDAMRIMIGSDFMETRSLPARIVHRGNERRIVIDGEAGQSSPDPVLLKLVALASAMLKTVTSGKADGLVDHYSKRHQWQLLRIAYLAPDITAAIVAGKQPVTLTGRRLLRATDIPLDWAAQRRMFGFN
jgi:DNA invertase Pin-like site-specific DNA recombinase